MRRSRSGFHSPESIAQPDAPPKITAPGIAIQNGRPKLTNMSAITAPKVTISPWAKLGSAVVPNTSDSPMDASPRRRPKFKPSNRRIMNWSKTLMGVR